MSGALATLSRGADIARGAVQSGTALANLFTGGTAGGTLTLGSFVFADFELPESISCGGSQQINTHRLTGGGRILDSMGADEAPISWSGIFLSNQAASRAAQLSDMRRAGALVPLAWGGINVPVVVTDVTLEWRRSYHVGYRITCTVVPPPPPGKPGADEDDDLDDMDDLDPEGGVLGALGDAAADVGGVVSDVADAAGQALGIAQGALAAVSGVVGPITQALGIQLPFLSTLSVELGLAGSIVGSLGNAGAALSGFGGGALDVVGWDNSQGLSAADDYLDGEDGEGAEASDDLDSAASLSRDAAVGSRSGAAINSAQVAQRQAANNGGNLPVRPIPPADGGALSDPGSTASGDLPGASAAAPTASVAPTAVQPGNATQSPAPPRETPDPAPAATAAPDAQSAAAAAAKFDSQIANRDAGQVELINQRVINANVLATQLRATGLSENQVKQTFIDKGRADLYRPPTAGHITSLPP